MLLDHTLQDIPDHRVQSLHHLLRILDIVRLLGLDELLHDERLEELDRHLLRHAALIDLKLRSDDDYRTAGVVHPLSEQVLTEAPLLSLEHIGERLQGPVSGACDRAAPAAVVDQSVHRLLQHSLLISHDDLGRSELQKTRETIVSVDDPPVEVIQIRGRKAAAVQLHHRAEIRRNHREIRENHPLRPVPGGAEGFHYLEALHDAGSLLPGGLVELRAKIRILLLEIDGAEKLQHGLRPHAGAEGSAAVLLQRVPVLLLGEDLLILEPRIHRIQHDIGGEVEHSLQNPGADVQDQSHPGGDALKIPDMRDRSRERDMAHSLPADGGLRHLDAAAVADHALIADLFVLAAVALPVLDRSEDALTEETVLFGL